MARQCDGCKRLIEQKNDEYVELSARALDATEGDMQDSKTEAHHDYCDQCLADGTALRTLLAAIDWKLEKVVDPLPVPTIRATQFGTSSLDVVGTEGGKASVENQGRGMTCQAGRQAGRQ